MPSTDSVSGLFATCQTEIMRLLTAFADAPSRSGLADVGAVAELVVLGDRVPDTVDLRKPVCDAAARWLRSGLLEDLSVARVELMYHTALLCYLAQQSDTFEPADMVVMKRLCEGRIIGRSEMPVLTQQLVAAYLTRCGIATSFGDLGERDFTQMIDKRALRARSDEYDLLVLLMCAQLIRLGACPPEFRPALYPRLLLVQSMRSRNANWLPVLSFLCSRYFPVDDGLRRAALNRILLTLPAPGELLPAPQGAGIDSEFIGRAGRGLRIRSTLALIFALCAPGETNVHDRASFAVA
jgi:hypothetical protein